MKQSQIISRLPKNQSIVLACSGGLDSMALFNALFLDSLRDNFWVAHVDHGQRKESAADARFVAAEAKRAGAKFILKKPKLKPKSSEATLRKARYEALLEIAREHDAVLVTAHHADDDLETFLLKLMRGAHPESIQGIRAESTMDGVKVARPLLDFTRDEIHEYAKARKLKWREDASNKDTKFTRNAVRAKLIPLLEEIRPGSAKRMLRFFRDLKVNEISPLDTQFKNLKREIDEKLGEHASRTTRAHWDALKRQLSLRAATKSGGGPRKTLQFPGGHSLTFDGKSLFWR